MTLTDCTRTFCENCLILFCSCTKHTPDHWHFHRRIVMQPSYHLLLYYFIASSHRVFHSSHYLLKPYVRPQPSASPSTRSAYPSYSTKTHVRNRPEESPATTRSLASTYLRNASRSSGNDGRSPGRMGTPMRCMNTKSEVPTCEPTLAMKVRYAVLRSRGTNASRARTCRA